MQPDFPDYSGFPDYQGSPWLKNSNPAVPHQNPRFPIFTHFVASYYYLISISGLSGFSGLLKFLFCSNLPMVLSYTQKNKVSRAFLHYSNKLLLLYPFFFRIVGVLQCQLTKADSAFGLYWPKYMNSSVKKTLC